VIVYEVNLDVRAEVYPDYRAWLAAHVAEILALPGFVSAEVFEVRDPAPAEGRRLLTICYRLADQAALERYFAEHAPRMREDGKRRFGDAFTATRRVLASV
jgi:antibiotic biosynthesis monooxygenase (ABM) superfamily enzyme